MIRHAMLSIAIALTLATTSRANELDLLRRVYGAEKLVAISGNGSLTVGVDDRGRIALCRWPSTSFYDQLTYESRDGAVPDHHGIYWGLEVNGEIIWTNDDRFETHIDYENARIIVINGSLRSSEITYRQEVFVDPDRDILVSHLALSGIDASPRLHLYANFTPCTRKLPELPVADWGPFDRLNDFAAFTHEGRVHHLRPEQPGATHWDYAQQLADGNATPADWAELGAGVYMAYESLEKPVEATVFADSGGAISRLEKQQSVVGQTAGRLSIIPSRGADGFRATVVTAFGASLSQVTTLLDHTRTESYAALRSKALDGPSREQPSEIIQRASPAVRSLLARSLAIIEACTDRRSGAIVRSPATQPPLARDWPRHGVWMTLALDYAGRHEDATRHLNFYLRSLRETSQRSQPAGTLAAALYADATPAAPHIILDTEAVGWLLWSLGTHAEFLDQEQRAAFATRAWERIEIMGDFIATWTDSLRGAPLPAFDATRFHDRQSRGQLVSTHAGLVAAIRLARWASAPAPEEWTQAKANSDVLLQNIFFAEGDTWPEDAPLPVSLTAIPDVNPDAALGLVKNVLEQRRRRLANATGDEAARLLLEQAMVARHHPGYLATLTDILEDALVSALREKDQEGKTRPAFPDALAAAQCYVAASIILGADAPATR